MTRVAALLLLLGAAPAFGQQAPDAAFLQQVLVIVENQRNQALAAHALAEAKLAGAADDLAKARARIKELESERGDKK